MTHSIDEIIKTLLLSEVSVSELEAAQESLKTPELRKLLNNPTVTIGEKNKVVDELFHTSVSELIKQLSVTCDIDLLDDIKKAYIAELDRKNKVARATLYYVTEPNAEQLIGIKKFVMREANAGRAEIDMVYAPTIIGGFIIEIGNKVYDRSLKSKLTTIKEKIVEEAKVTSGEDTAKIISILKSTVNDFDFEGSDDEIGTVISVGDGIATIHGLDHVMYGEIVVFENGVKAMVQDIKFNSVGCILFGHDSEVHAGSKVRRTRKKAGVPVGSAFIGRIVNALGEPIDGLGEIETEAYRLVEQPTPSIVDRKSVCEPLETGILAIDSMFPIGRGQRELIIGDRQTGKTSIAIDTILNQKGKNCICIYNAIGQKASTVAKLVGTLKKYGAMDYTVVVCSTASDPASLQYISPYSATAIAEHFMYQGKDCLIVYDDLSKHAVAYRALSLLLERSPGREAYPGDVFYLHSRLLERSSRLSDELGGGSITALPIIETQAGDVSAYIPTNVISITDGQIFLESDLFFSGQRPAVNVGLSVSRVGGAAQTKAMKKAAGSLRVDLAQYREMEVFTQFSSDLDEETKAGLNYGKGLMELLKQPLSRPMSSAQQVITLVCAIGKKFAALAPSEIKPYQARLLDYFENTHFDIINEIEQTHDLSPELKEKILKAADEFGKANNG